MPEGNRRTGISPDFGSMLAGFRVFFGCRFRSRSGCRFFRSWGPTWPQLGPLLGVMLDTFWDIFGCCFGIFIQDAILIDFCLISDPPEPQKTLKNQWFFKGFCFFARSLLRPLLDRFWDDFGVQNRPRIGPESVSRANKPKNKNL